MRVASRLVAHPAFGRAVVGLIIVNAIVVGLETDRRFASALGPALPAFHALVLAAFVVELGLRLTALGPAWRRFFRSGWNLFDLGILVLSALPAVGAAATVARIARVLRVARVVSISPKLRVIVTTMVRSIPSLGHVGMLLALLLYVYGVIGVELFREVDPVHWGSMSAAFLTLFQVLTLEGWVELQRTGMEATPLAWIFYGSFVLIAVFVVVNLFIAVVLTHLDDARRELEGQAAAASTPTPTPTATPPVAVPPRAQVLRRPIRPRAARFR